ncbi:MAG: hypothetical protein WDO15_03255 [Bacteroidota bacterium]
MKHSITTFFVSATMLLASCNQKENPNPVNYSGPMREGENVTMLYAEKDMLKMKLIGKKVLEFENGDREFPEGLFMEFIVKPESLRVRLLRTTRISSSANTNGAGAVMWR